MSVPTAGQVLPVRHDAAAGADSDVARQFTSALEVACSRAYGRGAEEVTTRALEHAAKLDSDADDHGSRAVRAVEERDYAAATLHANKAATAGHAAAMIRRAVTGGL